MSSRSSPVRRRAVTGKVSEPNSTTVSGWATRLWNQSGLVSAPPLLAKMKIAVAVEQRHQWRDAFGAGLGALVVNEHQRLAFEHPACLAAGLAGIPR